VFRARILRDAGWQSVRVVGDVPWAYRCYRRAVQAEWRQAFHPRTLVGLGLSLVPRWGRAWLNGLGNTLSAAKGNAIYVDRPDIEAG